MNLYDQLNFTSRPSPERHPHRLSSIARLRGISAADPDGCRFLEIGCSTGAHLLPLAIEFPDSHFVGVDIAGEQLKVGIERASKLTLSNIEFIHSTLEDFSQTAPFDFIVCHGMYSWVEEDVRRAIFECISKLLTPNGVAYVSYNCRPGSNWRDVVAKLVQGRDRASASPEQRIQEARAALAKANEQLVDAFRPYGMGLRDEIERCLERSDSFLLHELLNYSTQSFLLEDVVLSAQEVNLCYLGDALPTRMRTLYQNDSLRIERDEVKGEQHADYLIPSSLRATLFIREQAQQTSATSLRVLSAMHLSSPLVPMEEHPDVFSEALVTFCGPTESTVDIRNQVLKGALLYLRNSWPESVPWVELVQGAEALSGGSLSVESERDQFYEEFFDLYRQNLLELMVSPLKCVRSSEDYPHISPLVELELASQEWVTTLRHECFHPNELEREVLLLLPSCTSRDELLSKFVELFLSGRYQAKDSDGLIGGREKIGEVAKEELTRILHMLGEAALFFDPSQLMKGGGRPELNELKTKKSFWNRLKGSF